MRPLLLPPNQFHRFYAGGARIDRLRGLPEGEDGRPEDWVGSATTAFGEEREGLSAVEDGRLVRDLLAEDPDGWLGPEHAARWGTSPALLVKLLDAGQRLPVHAHPGRPFAREHLGLAFGKTEAWIILEAGEDAAMHVGLSETVGHDDLRGWVERQDAEEMLAAMHRVAVAPGDAIFVPAGTLHAIGAGILLAELQEPTDLSVLLEWRSFGVQDGSEHLRLGWETALTCIDLSVDDPVAAGRVENDRAEAPVERVLPAAADPYFRAERLRPALGAVDRDPSPAVLIVLDGEGRLTTERGDALGLARGRTVLVPHGAGRTGLDGTLDVLRCLPPEPGVEEGRW